MSLLSLQTSAQGQSVRITLSGELDLSSALTFEQEMRRAEEGDTDLVLDLRALKFMDSTGLRLILSAHTRALKRGHRLAIVLGTEAVRRIFRLAGVTDRLELVDEAPVAPSAG